MKRVVTAMLVIAAIIHLLPLSGVLSGERLSILYGISFDENNIEILMRHRAVLFGLLGALLLYTAFNVQYQLIGLMVGLVSVVSFLLIAKSVGDYNAELSRVFLADLVALVCLVIGLVVYFVHRTKTSAT